MKLFFENYLNSSDGNPLKLFSNGLQQFLASNGKFINSLFRTKDRRNYQPNLALWDTRDPRIDLALFQSNVPSFVINQDQRFLDWNIAFELAFGELHDLKKGVHISNWYEHLDNFRSVPKRVDRLYGEGVLPICDRERVTFKSKKYGRMVFTKIMSPILDRTSGKIIGWTVALNINSITKRTEYFEALYKKIERHEKHVRYISAFDHIYGASKAFQSLVEHHLFYTKEEDQVLELGAFNGASTKGFLSLGAHVTTVDPDVETLRSLRDKVILFKDRVKIVKRTFKQLSDLPKARFDIVSLGLSLHRFDDLEKTLLELSSAMKQDGRLLISVFHEKTNIDLIFNEIREELESDERIETLKYQFNHVLEHERAEFQDLITHIPSRTEFSNILSRCGFRVEHSNQNFWNGEIIFLSLRKAF